METQEAKRRLMATAVFVVVVGGVIAAFAYLGTQDSPPHMPSGPSGGAQHTLRFNLKGDLIGLASEPPVDPLAASGGNGFVYDKKAVEKRVNDSCKTCHGEPAIDLSSHACRTGIAPCIPEHHPPKSECIKCHRMGPSGPAQ